MLEGQKFDAGLRKTGNSFVNVGYLVSFERYSYFRCFRKDAYIEQILLSASSLTFAIEEVEEEIVKS
jgi:hypothetical protein